MQGLDRRTKVALGAMSLAVFVIANDITSLSVALPTIERDFHVDVETVQWVMNAYTLVFGVMIVTGGRLSDMLGRRRTFFVGITIFAVCSGFGAVAWSTGTLIGARAAMAIGAALIWPSVVGLVFGLVPPERAGLAGGLLLGVSGIGNALGPMIGGGCSPTS
jgi:MFS family permease